jgi:hypothetical protein
LAEVFSLKRAELREMATLITGEFPSPESAAETRRGGNGQHSRIAVVAAAIRTRAAPLNAGNIFSSRLRPGQDRAIVRICNAGKSAK